MRMMAVLMAALMMAGCASSKTPVAKKKMAPSGFVQGKATVLEVDNSLGLAVLKFNGKRTPAYWESDIVTPFHVSTVDSHQTTPAPTQDLANAKDAIHPTEEHVDLQAKPGDTIVFRGMWTGKDLLLRSVAVVPN